jgi:hypothetical protein
MKNTTILIAKIIFSCFIVFEEINYAYGEEEMKMTSYIKTKEPLLLSAGENLQYFHILPAGAALYKFETFSEGHTTYIAYINIKGDFARELVESKYSVDPMWASTIRPEDVQVLLDKTPVSKDDLVRILKARKMTRDDLAQIVREWKD